MIKKGGNYNFRIVQFHLKNIYSNFFPKEDKLPTFPSFYPSRHFESVRQMRSCIKIYYSRILFTKYKQTK